MIENNNGSAAMKVNPLGVEPVSKLILKFAIPSTLAFVVNGLYNIVDQIFIGQGVGFLGNGATNVVFPLMIFMSALALLFGDGCAAFYNLELGRGNKKTAAQAAGTTVISVIIVSVIIMALSLVFMEPICRMFGATKGILPYAMDYGYIIAIGFPFVSIDMAVSAIVRADGSPTYSMIGLLLGCALNMVFDPLFIFVFGWGVKGAAFATIIGQIANAVFLLLYLRRIKSVQMTRDDYKVRGSILKRFLPLGISSFIMQMAAVIVITTSNKMMVKFGALSKYGEDIPISVMGICMKVASIVNNIVMGISIGSQPIFSFNYGARKYDRVKDTYRRVIIACTITVTVAFLIFQLTPMTVVSLFGSESELYNEFSVKCFTIYLLLLPLNGFQMSTGVFFQALGKPGISALNALAKQVFFLVPSIIILAYAMGIDGTLWAGAVADGLAFLLTLFLLLFNWKKFFPSAEKA